MYSKLFLLFKVAISLVFIGCNNPNQNNTRIGIAPQNLDLTDAQAIFIGYSESNNSQRNVLVDNNTLYKVDSSGNISVVEFYDDNNNRIEAKVHSLSKKSSKYIGMSISTSSTQGSATNLLLELDSGSLFDLGDTDVRYCISPILGTRQLVYNTMSGIIYKIDLDTLISSPLNNPNFDSYYGYFWNYEDDTNAIYSLPQMDNTIIIKNYDGTYKVDLNGINPPEKYTESSFFGYPLTNELNLANGLPVFTSNGSVYSFEVFGLNLKVFRNGILLDELFGASILDNNMLLNINVSFAYSIDNYYIYKSGLLYLSSNSDGTINYDYIKKDLSFLFEEDAKFYKKGNIVYCLNGNTFKKVDVINDTNYSLIYESEKKVKNSWIMNEDIYFTIYNSATDISTFLLKKGETNPVLLSTSSMDIKQLIEFGN